MKPSGRSRATVGLIASTLLAAGLLSLLRAGGVRIPRAATGVFRGDWTGRSEVTNVTFVSLTYNGSEDLPVLEHNCLRLKRAGYKFHVHTDDPSLRLCGTCTCVPFITRECVCPAVAAATCRCNKLHFIIDAVRQYPELVFLDTDVVIMNDELMPALLARAVHFDFLAAYGFPQMVYWSYKWFFNSGLMFIRRLDGLNYSEMIDFRDRSGKNGDQIAVSRFVHEYYDRWDVLSLRWHCRFLFRREYSSINPYDCYAFHGHEIARNRTIPNFEYLTF